jgi:hypothetical protein
MRWPRPHDTIREMRFALVLLLEAIAVASLACAGWSGWRASSSFYVWFWPLYEGGELNAGGRMHSLETWRRLLGERPEDELVSEQRRLLARMWTIRAARFGGGFFCTLALALLL